MRSPADQYHRVTSRSMTVADLVVSGAIDVSPHHFLTTAWDIAQLTEQSLRSTDTTADRTTDRSADSTAESDSASSGRAGLCQFSSRKFLSVFLTSHVRLIRLQTHHMTTGLWCHWLQRQITPEILLLGARVLATIDHTCCVGLTIYHSVSAIYDSAKYRKKVWTKTSTACNWKFTSHHYIDTRQNNSHQRRHDLSHVII